MTRNMTRFLFIFSLVFLSVGFSAESIYARSLPMQTSPASFADLAEHLLPAVVNISSTQVAEKFEEGEGMDGEGMTPDDGLPPGFPMPNFPPGSPFEDFFKDFMNRRGMPNQDDAPALPATSLGSGFIIDAEKGYIVTNNHVVKDAAEIRVTLHDDSTIDAELVGHDEKTDLAVLKVKTNKKLTAVPFGKSDPLRVGDWVLAIGNPFGLGGTVTAGIISAQKRDIHAGPYDDFIQTDASINRGNSGGPMFNLAGEVIGINTAIFSPTGGSVGIGFAIPSDLATPVIRQLIEFGHTRRGWLGVRIQKVTEEIAESLGLDKAEGALVASVTPGGPAEKAKLKAGDVILNFNGKPVKQMRHLPRIVAETRIGEPAPIVFWRDGQKETVSIKIGELEKAEEEGLLETSDHQTKKNTPKKEPVKTLKLEGLSLSKLMPQARETYGISDDIHGVLIRQVDPRSEAAENGLNTGDVIVEVNQKTVLSPKEVKTLFDAAEKKGRKSILLLVARGHDVRFVALRLKDRK